jgi:hypothetical protein
VFILRLSVCSLDCLVVCQGASLHLDAIGHHAARPSSRIRTLDFLLWSSAVPLHLGGRGSSGDVRTLAQRELGVPTQRMPRSSSASGLCAGCRSGRLGSAVAAAPSCMRVAIACSAFSVLRLQRSALRAPLRRPCCQVWYSAYSRAKRLCRMAGRQARTWLSLPSWRARIGGTARPTRCPHGRSAGSL